MDAEQMIAEDHDHYRDKSDKLREAVERLKEADTRSGRARERLAVACAKALNSEISILERYTKLKQTITTEATE